MAPLKPWFRELGRLFFDERCIACAAPGGPVCSACRAAQKPVPNPCQRCGHPTRVEDTVVTSCAECKPRAIPFERARSLWLYQSPTDELIRRIKFHNQFALFEHIKPSWDAFGETQLKARSLTGQPVLTWVPPQTSRQLDRAVTLSRLLAESLAGRLNWRAAPLLEKIRETPAQMALDHKSRALNLKGAFRVPEGGLESVNGPVVLVDDIFTTGHTAIECAKTLKKAGLKPITVLTLARAAPGFK